MTRDAWSPKTYRRFGAEREQPFLDLLALVRPVPGMRVVDLGCGTGALTRRLHETLGARETLGIDASEAMLAESAAHAVGGVRFTSGDLGTFEATRAYDLVFSNSALHWVPEHRTLLRRLAGAIAPGGQLAFQVPANFDHPSHRIAAAVAREAPFQALLGGHVHAEHTVLAPEEYAACLDELGFAEQHVRLQVYAHRLDSRAAVVDWVRGTLLTPYASRLSREAFDRFLARYRERWLEAVPDGRPYRYLFKRILAWGMRAPA